MRPGRHAGFLALALGLLALAGLDAVVGLVVPAAPVDTEGPPADRAALDARLDAFFDAAAEADRGTVFLGDSVVRGGHLAVPSARLPARFAADTGRRVLDLAVDGLLYSSLDCYVEAVLARRPAALVLDLSARPLSADFGASEPCPACEPEAPRPVRWLRRHSALVGRRVSLQSSLFGGPPTSRVLAGLAQVVGAPPSVGATPLPGAPGAAEAGLDAEDPEEAEVLARMALVLKAAARLGSVAVDPARPQLAALDALLVRIAAGAEATGTRVAVLMVEENLAALSPQLDAIAYARARDAFTARVEAALAGRPGVSLVRLTAASLQERYVDHVHLDAAGYAFVSARLAEALR